MDKTSHPTNWNFVTFFVLIQVIFVIGIIAGINLSKITHPKIEALSWEYVAALFGFGITCTYFGAKGAALRLFSTVTNNESLLSWNSAIALILSSLFGIGLGILESAINAGIYYFLF